MTNELAHNYHLGESTLILRGIGSDLHFFSPFFDVISLSKENSPRWDGAFCGVISWDILFAYVP